ncbi:MAG: DUF2085 domain-containing protein [Melioribacter sp.]|uniref:DUF2085 domain-containing protein n=1 Tax=Rosettibacter primus TaxID=3111523 RepID=UPI00247D37DC|nr:DUF2085 domain-containing protein [Melioribacter sp.]
MRLRFKLLIFILISIWYTGIFFECLTKLYPKSIIILPFIKKTYSLVCHQKSGKLIELNCGHSLVCSRCAGIYSGILLSSIVSLVVKKILHTNLKFLFISIIPIIIDILFVSLNIYSYSKTLAFFTGFLFGSVLFLYFYKSLINLFNEIQLDK